jgi:hypothetical protein
MLPQQPEPPDRHWEQILNQIVKTTVPSELVSEIHFYYNNTLCLKLDLESLDTLSITLMQQLLADPPDDELSIRLMVDQNKMKKIVTDITEGVLQHIPRKTL